MKGRNFNIQDGLEAVWPPSCPTGHKQSKAACNTKNPNRAAGFSYPAGTDLKYQIILVHVCF